MCVVTCLLIKVGLLPCLPFTHLKRAVDVSTNQPDGTVVVVLGVVLIVVVSVVLRVVVVVMGVVVVVVGAVVVTENPKCDK